MAGVIKEKIKEEIDSFFKTAFRTAKRKRTIEFGYEISKSSIKECHEYRISYVVCKNNVYSEKVLSIYFYYYRTKHKYIGRLKIEYDYSKVVLDYKIDIDLLRELEKFTYNYFKDLENKLSKLVSKEKYTKVREYKDIFKKLEVIYYLN